MPAPMKVHHRPAVRRGTAAATGIAVTVWLLGSASEPPPAIVWPVCWAVATFAAALLIRTPAPRPHGAARAVEDVAAQVVARMESDVATYRRTLQSIRSFAQADLDREIEEHGRSIGNASDILGIVDDALRCSTSHSRGGVHR